MSDPLAHRPSTDCPTAIPDVLEVLVRRTGEGDQRAAEEIYNMFSRGVRMLVSRQLGFAGSDDHVQEVMLIVLRAIKAGQVREPARLAGFVRTVTKRIVCSEIEKRQEERLRLIDIDTPGLRLQHPDNPVAAKEREEQSTIARQVLQGLSGRDREILTRFYLKEQSPARICREMGLNETQFRLLKCRAKDRFGLLGKRSIDRPSKPRRVWCTDNPVPVSS